MSEPTIIGLGGVAFVILAIAISALSKFLFYLRQPPPTDDDLTLADRRANNLSLQAGLVAAAKDGSYIHYG
jgi:hypothetical protein